MKQKKESKMYIVRKYIMACDCKQAMKLERTIPPHDVFVDQEWASGGGKNLADAIGFNYED